MRQQKWCNITPLLKELHWLPVEYRIKYKIVLLVYKCLHDKGPVYLSLLLKDYHPQTSMCLRSSKKELLNKHLTEKGYGDRAFAVAGPKLWNALSLDVRKSISVATFKAAIKTHYFEECYKS